MTRRRLGVAWYPEQWPREMWEADSRRMAEAGLSLVRIGEFAWSLIEPEPGRYEWGWLDDAIAVLERAGLDVILGTPTAAPPRWMLDRHPDMLAVDAEGRPRRFGSRRHYDFSHEGYRADCARIVEALARRYGRHPAVVEWQTDNEYGCHDTVLSYSAAARAAFQAWLAERYGTVEALNAAWGTVFWSMRYDRFDQIDLPNLTVTEPAPAHALDFRRFSSDQVVAFNRLQTEILRAHSDRPIAHNYMGGVTEFDHFAVGSDLEIASWDSYPLGFLSDRVEADEAWRLRFARQGDPDYQAFHHDLYRAVGRGRWQVMEQQPGPVNWAPWNPAPAPGAIRLWTWEAFAHGAEAVVYFRWRQAPFAQEQLHAGLLRPDDAEAPGLAEARRVAAELAEAPEAGAPRAAVGLIFDYDAAFAWDVQPHGAGLSYLRLVFDAYRALRRLGLSIDVLPAQTPDLDGRRLILAPGLVHMSDALKTALAESGKQVIVGPRAAARDRDFRIPVPLPPALPGLDARVAAVESLAPGMEAPLAGGGAARFWLERLEGGAEALEMTVEGAPAMLAAGPLAYLAFQPDAEAWARILRRACRAAGLETLGLPEGVRVRDAADGRWWFNHDLEERRVGDRVLPPLGVLREARSSASGS